MRKLWKFLMGFGVAAAGFFGTSLITSSCAVEKVEIKRHAPLEVRVLENKKKICEAIGDYQHRFFDGNDGYVSFMARRSSEIRKNIEYYGRGEVGRARVAEGYASLHKICLDMAAHSLGRETSEQEIDETADRLVIHMKDLAKETRIDYEHPAVKAGYKSFARNRIGFWKEFIKKALKSRALKANPTPKLEDIWREIYTREESIKDFADYDAVRKELYEGFAQSLKNNRDPVLGAVIRLFGPGIARATGERSAEFTKRAFDEIYPE